MPSLKKNILYQNLYQLLISLTPLITAPYTSRVLGAPGIGIYSYTTSVSSCFVLLAMIGINSHGARSIAAVRDDNIKLNQTFSDILILHIIVSIVVFAAYTVFLFGFSGEYRVFFSVQALYVLSAVADVNWFFSGIEQFKLMVTRSGIIKVCYVACVFIFVKSTDDLQKYLLMWSLAFLVPNTVIWLFLRRHVRFVKPSLNGMRTHVKPLFLLFVPIAAMSVYGIANKVMLGAVTGETELGYFENAMKVVGIVTGFIVAFNAVMIPRMSNITAAGKNGGGDEVKNRLTQISVRYVMMFAIALAFGIAAIASDFAPMFFGSGFKAVGGLLSGLCVIIPFFAFWNIISAQYLLPMRKDKAYTAAILAGAAVSVPANLLLIPKIGAMGAVSARVITDITICAAVVFFVRKALPIKTYVKSFAFFIPAGAAMYALVSVVGGGAVLYSLLFRIAAGAVLYLSLSAAYLFYVKDDFFVNNLERVKKAFVYRTPS